MKRLITMAGFLVALMVSGSASAASCADLWYKRNSIYAQYGYCFKSSLGQRTFGNEGCYTNSPKLSGRDKAIVDNIKREEARRGCKVND